MSFAVFGITWDYCLKKAQRQVKAYRIENGHRIAKSEVQPVKGQFHPKTKQPVMRYQPWVGGS